MSNVIRYKMVLFGNVSVGKTSLVERFINNHFEENYISTLGYTVYEKQFTYKDSIISLMVYDIGGQEQFRELRRKYAEGANAAFIVYDVTNLASFERVTDWRDNLREFAGDIPFILVGNKIDLENKRVVDFETGKKLANSLGAAEFFETSAKTGTEVGQAFKQLAVQTFQSFY